MNRPVLSLIGFVLLSMLLCAHAPAQEAPVLGEQLAAEGNARQYWIARTTTEGKSRVTSISKRTDPVLGTWAEVARFQSDITSCAAVGNRLAVLLPSGEWRMLEDSPGPLGPPLPAGYQPLRFAADGDALLAVATGTAPSTQPATQESVELSTQPTTRPLAAAVLRFADNAWSVVADLPHGMLAADADVIRTSGTLYAAGRTADSIGLWAYRGDAWERIWGLDGASVRQFELLHGRTAPLLATMNAAGSWSVFPIGSDKPVTEPSGAHLPSDTAMVGPTLRIVYVEDDQVKQLAYDDYGTGAAYPMTTIAKVPTHPQMMQSWVEIGALILLTVTMLLTFRQRPAMPSEALVHARYRVSPLGRRFAAGFIDAIPQLIGAAYTLDVMQASPTSAATLAANVPYLLGTAVYLLHVAICEAIWGRSLGKFLFGLRVVSYDGSRAPTERVILRNLLRLVDMFFYAPLLLIFLTPMRQRVGDLAAKTIVVYEADPEEEQPDTD